RGPVGLIGSTKSDAQETIANLVEDAQAGVLGGMVNQSIEELLQERQVPYTTWHGWEILDEYERELGESYGPTPSGDSRERVKVVSRSSMTAISRGEDTDVDHDLVGRPGELGKPHARDRFDDFTGPKEYEVSE
ncbi:MAG: pyridine nucleotide-disulfide oxidoreductase, partial [Scrofimicrobium sp.]